MDKAFIKGLRLIETLAASEKPRGITELANELGLTKSNVHRLLATLIEHGYVRQIPPHSTYELTTKIWQLGGLVIKRLNFIEVAHPALAMLSELTGETIHLSVLEGTQVVYVDKIEGAHHVRAHTSIGSRAPAWTVATGKSMLAQLPDSYLEQFRDQITPYTAASKKSFDELKADIDLIRQQGYASVPQGEWREGISACACAVLGVSGELVGAIGISGPDTRLKRKQIKEYSVHVMEASRMITRALGGRIFPPNV